MIAGVMVQAQHWVYLSRFVVLSVIMQQLRVRAPLAEATTSISVGREQSHPAL